MSAAIVELFELSERPQRRRFGVVVASGST
jgi:hypothetical protein